MLRSFVGQARRCCFSLIRIAAFALIAAACSQASRSDKQGLGVQCVGRAECPTEKGGAIGLAGTWTLTMVFDSAPPMFVGSAIPRGTSVTGQVSLTRVPATPLYTGDHSVAVAKVLGISLDPGIAGKYFHADSVCFSLGSAEGAYDVGFGPADGGVELAGHRNADSIAGTWWTRTGPYQARGHFVMHRTQTVPEEAVVVTAAGGIVCRGLRLRSGM